MAGVAVAGTGEVDGGSSCRLTAFLQLFRLPVLLILRMGVFCRTPVCGLRLFRLL